MWDSETGKPVGDFPALDGPASRVVFSPDGKHLAAATRGKTRTVKVWEVLSRREVLSQADRGTNVYYGRDGRLFSTCEDESRYYTKVWNLTDNVELANFRFTETFGGGLSKLAGNRVAISPDGKRAGVIQQRTLVLWDLEKREALRTFKGHTGFVSCVEFSPDGKLLMTGGQGLKLWQVDRDQEALTIHFCDNFVSALAFSADGKQLLSAGASPRRATLPTLWNTVTGQKLCELQGHTGLVRGVAFSPEGQLTTGGDSTVRIWHPVTGRLLRIIRSPKGVHIPAYSPDGRSLITSGRELKLWNAATGAEIRTFQDSELPTQGVAFSSDGKRVAASCFGGDIRVWEVDSGREVFHVKSVANVENARLAFQPGRYRLAVTCQDNTVKIWDLERGGEPLGLEGHTDRVTCLAFSPDGQRLFSGSHDLTVKIWDPETAQEILTLAGASFTVTALAISPDGQRLAAGTGDGTVRIWTAPEK
jgi:WD40 repeat protein